MTAATAIVVSRCIPPDKFHDVAIPFVIATGSKVSLYVTTLNEEGIPCIRVPEDPQGRRFVDIDISRSPSQERKELFVALAVLLNKFKRLFETFGRSKYREKIKAWSDHVMGLPKHTFKSVREESLDADSNDDAASDASPVSDSQRRGRSEEMAAQLAAACEGIFSNVEYPYIRTVKYYKGKGSVWEYQTQYPFYFKAMSTTATPKVPVFLKVWKAGHVNMAKLESEFSNHKLAFDAGAPVAAPVLGKPARSKGPDGAEYWVLAAEYLHNDLIKDVEEFVQFCESLIQTVDKLHIKSKLLHCDIKPDNIRWCQGVVRLIDFGHSQKIENATFARGTRGFEAPEILNRMPCSIKTDAYSVGRTILTRWKVLDDDIQQNQSCTSWHDIALKLADPDPTKRWSLSLALEKVQEMKKRDGSSLSPVKEYALIPNIISPDQGVEHGSICL